MFQGIIDAAASVEMSESAGGFTDVKEKFSISTNSTTEIFVAVVVPMF